MDATFERLFTAATQIKGIKNKAELARLLNISPQTLKNWESRGISSQGVIESAAILNISTQWLTNGTGEMKNNNSIHAPNNSGTQNNVIGTQNNFLPESSGSLKTMQMPDDSFAPLIPQGSELTYNTSDTSIKNGKIYLIQQGEQVFIRRAFPQLSGSLKWACENPAYGADELPPNAVQIVGRVVAWKVED